jgi:Na+-translocating ferredoxin:NAD+ oxidoreductase RnfE subunit
MFTDKALWPWSSYSDNLGSSPYLIRVRIPVYDHVILTHTTSRKIITDQLVSSQVYYKILVFLRLQVQSDLCLGRADLRSLSGGVIFCTKRS